MDIECARFAVNETGYCIWDSQIGEHNLDLLNSIDAGYFEHTAGIYGQLLAGEERQYAAVALRIAYSHALETLFALLGATVQAPNCVVGWLLAYQNKDLFEITRKIQNRSPVLSALRIAPVTWTTLSEIIHSFTTGDIEKDSRIRVAFARLWKRFADDFLNEKLDREYNSLKHGLRASIGGFWLAVGLQDVPGVPAPPERMRMLGSNEFGTSFFVSERLRDRYNLKLKRQSLNWNPENFVHALNLVAMSIGNIVSFLKIINGVAPSEVRFSWPTDGASFDEPWRRLVSMTSFEVGTIIDERYIQPLTQEQILSAYTQADRD